MRNLKTMLGFAGGLLLGIMFLFGNTLSDRIASDEEEAAAIPYRTIRHWGAATESAAMLLPAWTRLGEAGAQADALSHASARIVWLQDEDGTTNGVGIKLSLPGPDHSPLLGRYVASAHWSFFWPGNGSAFATSVENLWPVMRDRIRSRIRTTDSSENTTALMYRLTGSGRADSGVLTGSSGQYAGTGGRLVELAEASESGAVRGLLLMKFSEE